MLSYQIIVVNNFEELSDSDETKVFFREPGLEKQNI